MSSSFPPSSPLTHSFCCKRESLRLDAISPHSPPQCSSFGQEEKISFHFGSKGRKLRRFLLCFRIYSLVRICYANLTIQFESLVCFVASFYDTFLSRARIQGIAVAYISDVTATEHEISISPRIYKEHGSSIFPRIYKEQGSSISPRIYKEQGSSISPRLYKE